MAFPWVVTSTRRVYDLYFYFMTGTPEGSTASGYMEKPGIEPATPGLQDRFIPYITAASLDLRWVDMSICTFCWKLAHLKVLISWVNPMKVQNFQNPELSKL